VIGIIGIILAIIFYLRSRQRALLAFQQIGLKLLGHNSTQLPSEVSVQYRGKMIPRLTKTVLVLWNAGEKTISGDDIVASDPLRIETQPQSEILSTVIVKATRQVLNLRLEQPPDPLNLALIKFDFLDAGDGAVLEILHTAQSSVAIITGTVKGIPRGFKRLALIIKSRSVASPIRLRFRMLSWAALGFGALVTTFGIFLLGKIDSNIPDPFYNSSYHERLALARLCGFLCRVAHESPHF
jgi:hypothetical protein